MTPDETMRRPPLHARAGCPLCARLVIVYRHAGRLIYPSHSPLPFGHPSIRWCAAAGWLVEDDELVGS